MGKILLVLALIGAMTYALFWLIEQRRARRSGGPSGGARPQRPTPGGPPRVTGPDDDPAFLRDIERRRREQQRRADGKLDGRNGGEDREGPGTTGGGRNAGPEPV